MCGRCCQYLSFQQQLPGCNVRWQQLSFSLLLTKACKEELGTSQSFASEYRFIKENCMLLHRGTMEAGEKKNQTLHENNFFIYGEVDFWKESRLETDMWLLSIDKCINPLALSIWHP